MKNALLKFAGLFVERIPPEELRSTGHGSPEAHATPRGPAGPASGSVPTERAPSTRQPLHMPGPPPRGPHAVRGADAVADSTAANRPVAVALRAWVPESYAGILAAHGLHIVAAGGALTSDQARTWGAEVLLLSMECLGSDTHLLTNPAIATVFIAHQPMMVAQTPGLVQVGEPLRASELATAARTALAEWHRSHTQ
jgi:hypothetical protein